MNTREKKLEESEEKYRSLVEGLTYVGIGIDIVSIDYKILFQNQFLIERYGDFTGEKCYEKYMNLEKPCDFCPMVKAIKNNIVESEEITKPDGKSYKLISAPFPNLDGTIDKAVEVVIDITKQKNAEQKLKESEERYRELVELLPDLVAEVNTKLELTYANSIAFELFGYSQEDFNKGLKVIQMIAPEDLVKASKNMKKVFNGEIIGPIDYLLLKKDGTKFYGRINSRPIYKEGRITGLRCVISDVTKRKKAEEKIKESEAKYRDAYNLVSFYKDVFTHDMNNILQNILTSVELLSLFLDNPEKSEENKEILQILRSQVKRSANLILNVRKLTKLEETQIGIKSTEAINFLRKTIEFVKKSVQDREILIKVDTNFEKVFIQANELLVDIFENILLNSVKYNDNTQVEIIIIISKIQKEGIKYLKLEFKDNGIGVTDVAKDIIFKGGYKRDKKFRGMGLGLSLVKKILENYNGEIWVEDRVPGDYTKGSNFVILIPETV